MRDGEGGGTSRVKGMEGGKVEWDFIASCNLTTHTVTLFFFNQHARWKSVTYAGQVAEIVSGGLLLTQV